MTQIRQLVKELQIANKYLKKRQHHYPLGNTIRNTLKILPHLSQNGYHQEINGGERGKLFFWWKCKLVHQLWKTSGGLL